MFWIGLQLPDLALECLIHDASASADGLAVVEGHRIRRADDAARRAGVRSGMSRATALALAPWLSLRAREPEREAATLARRACWAQGFTPFVSLQPPDTLLLEVTGSLRLFGGLRPLRDRLVDGLRALGHRVGHAAAPTPGAAALLARHADGTLTASDTLSRHVLALPVSALASATPHVSWLVDAGIRCCGDLSGLPRAELDRRAGPEVLRELDRVLGRVPDPRDWFAVPGRFVERLELPFHTESVEALAPAATRLLHRLADWLGTRQAATSCFVLHLCHEEGPSTEIVVSLASPSRDPARFLTLLRERLHGCRLPAPVETLRLECAEASEAPSTSASLLPAAPRAGEALERLIERLHARLGPARVRRPVPYPDHRPERASGLAKFRPDGVAGRRATPVDAPRDPPTGPRLPRPLWLLDPPQRLLERDGRPWLRGALRIVAGPERIEGGWWDLHPVRRDYFIAEDDEGILHWIFRTPVSDAAGGAWFLQGRFG